MNTASTTRKAPCQSLLSSAIPFALSIAIALAGCGGVRAYPDHAEKNLTIRTATDDGSVLSSTRASLHVFSVDDQCQKTYEGTVKLARQTVEVGLPRESLSYLVFEFHSSGFLSNTSSSITQSTLLKPRAGAAYAADVSYIDDIYLVAMTQKGTTAGSSTTFDLIPFAACSPG